MCMPVKKKPYHLQLRPCWEFGLEHSKLKGGVPDAASVRLKSL
jgi:hypothetical protein